MILHASGTQTAVIGTEHSLATATVPGLFRLHVDLSNMAANDVLELRANQIVLTGGTKRLAFFQQYYGVQSPIVEAIAEDLWNELADASSLEWTLKQTFGTGRDFAWKVLREPTPAAAFGAASGPPLLNASSQLLIGSNVKKNSALAKFEFLMTDAVNHAPMAGLGAGVTVTRSIDGAAFAAGTLSAVSEVANGIYSVDFAAGDLNGNVIVLKATGAGADTTFERIITVP